MKYIFLVALVFILSCNDLHAQVPPLYNVHTFPGIYSEVAISINKEDTTEIINRIKQNHLDPNYLDPKHHISLLIWAMANRKYNSCKTLLELGADPNQNIEVPPITAAAHILDSSIYLKLMLDHGGNPNLITKDQDSVSYTEASPLCAASSTSLENVKLLVDYGANINLNPYGDNLLLTNALILNKMDIIHYLIFEKKADVFKVRTIDNGVTSTITNLLRLMPFRLGSEDYKQKMEIVNYIKTLGIDYWSAPIPEFIRKQYSKNYLKKY